MREFGNKETNPNNEKGVKGGKWKINFLEWN